MLATYRSSHEVPVYSDFYTRRCRTDEYMNCVTTADLQPPELRVCTGMPMMLIRNLNVAAGQCHGTRVFVCEHSPRELYVRVLGVPPGDPNEYASQQAQWVSFQQQSSM